jgi:predicted ATP-grasp superfamily ATP-dependent carboligase
MRYHTIPGGDSSIHIYNTYTINTENFTKQTTHRTTQNYIEKRNTLRTTQKLENNIKIDDISISPEQMKCW